MTPTEAGRQLRSLLGGLGVSRTLLTRLKAAQGVLVNGSPAFVSSRVAAGDEIRLVLPEEPSAGIEPEDLPLHVVFEDDDMLVVDKPAHQLVHPVRSQRAGTVANAVAWRWRAQGLLVPVRPLHRLDRDTSGLVLFARNPWAYGRLLAQLQQRSLVREYQALVSGRVAADTGRITAPIGPVVGHRAKHQVDPAGKPAATVYHVLRRWPEASLLALTLETGRTHQIRIHMAHAGHPLLGDPLYGVAVPPGLPPLERQALHACHVSLRHPRTGAPLYFSSPLPADLAALVAALNLLDQER